MKSSCMARVEKILYVISPGCSKARTPKLGQERPAPAVAPEETPLLEIPKRSHEPMHAAIYEAATGQNMAYGF